MFTTRPDPNALRAAGPSKRNFAAKRPNALWVTDLTGVPRDRGIARVRLIVNAFSQRIGCWRVATHMRTDMVLEALETTRAHRGPAPRRPRGPPLEPGQFLSSSRRVSPSV